MPKLTLEEKRRETLRRQLYGNEVISEKAKVKSNSEVENKASETKTISMANYSPSTSHSQLLTSNYLTSDLIRILIISSIAISIQISLYFLLQNNLVKLPF